MKAAIKALLAAALLQEPRASALLEIMAGRVAEFAQDLVDKRQWGSARVCLHRCVFHACHFSMHAISPLQLTKPGMQQIQDACARASCRPMAEVIALVHLWCRGCTMMREIYYFCRQPSSVCISCFPVQYVYHHVDLNFCPGADSGHSGAHSNGA